MLKAGLNFVDHEVNPQVINLCGIDICIRSSTEAYTLTNNCMKCLIRLARPHPIGSKCKTKLGMDDWQRYEFRSLAFGTIQIVDERFHSSQKTRNRHYDTRSAGKLPKIDGCKAEFKGDRIR